MLNVAWVVGTQAWHPAVRISAALALRGTPVAMAKQTDNRLVAAFIDRTGRLEVAAVDGTGIWQAPIAIGDAVGQPGGAVTLAKPSSNQLSAAFIDKWGTLEVASVTGLGAWEGPSPVGGQVGVPGSRVGLAHQSDGHFVNRLVAAFADNTGTLTVAMRNLNTGQWEQAPTTQGNPVTVPGGAVALAEQSAGFVTAALIDGNGVFNVAWADRTGTWRLPVAVGGLCKPGAPVALAKQGDSHTDILTAGFLDSRGAFTIAWVVGNGAWNGPVAVSEPVSAPGGGVALANQYDNVFTAALMGNSRTLNVAWVVNNGSWHPPVPIS
ncbi:MAG: hypothetical protein ACRDRK_19660 [Pseudonocardia sp.]